MNVLYLDFDGVLHPVRGGEPFVAVPVLQRLLEPYPRLKIVLSTSWVKAHGYQQTIDFLPERMGRRVIDGTYGPHPPGPGFSGLSRWEQIRHHVQELQPRAWLALDDDDRGWPDGDDRGHLVHVPGDTGLLGDGIEARVHAALSLAFSDPLLPGYYISEKQFWAGKRERQHAWHEAVGRGEVKAEDTFILKAADLSGAQIQWPRSGFTASEEDDNEQEET